MFFTPAGEIAVRATFTGAVLNQPEQPPLSQAIDVVGAVGPGWSACAVVRTTVPWAARGASHAANCDNVDALTEYVSQPLQTWWKTRSTQPPPCCSAFVT